MTSTPNVNTRRTRARAQWKSMKSKPCDLLCRVPTRTSQRAISKKSHDSRSMSSIFCLKLYLKSAFSILMFGFSLLVVVWGFPTFLANFVGFDQFVAFYWFYIVFNTLLKTCISDLMLALVWLTAGLLRRREHSCFLPEPLRGESFLFCSRPLASGRRSCLCETLISDRGHSDEWCQTAVTGSAPLIADAAPATQLLF